ncbi:MAG: helix-turn-helix domain-containing protein [Chloroflexota bacterium]|nr:helix-turn-helix domain-containing protein [Chloroflexota bacterium]
MQTKTPATPGPPKDTALETTTLDGAIRDHVRTYALWHGRPQAARRFGVSRHTLWRFLERGHLGRSLPRSVVRTVGDASGAVAAAACTVTASRRVQRRAADSGPLTATQEDTLRFL